MFEQFSILKRAYDWKTNDDIDEPKAKKPKVIDLTFHDNPHDLKSAGLGEGNHDDEEVVVLSKDSESPVERRGSGHKGDPIIFPEWESGNIINPKDHGRSFMLLESDDGGKSVEEANANHTRNSPFRSRSSPTMKHDNDTTRDNYQDEEPDDEDCIFLDANVLPQLHKQPWAFSIKEEKPEEEEEEDELPDLTSSQETLGSQGPKDSIWALERASACFDEQPDWERALGLEDRKRLFLYKYWELKRDSLKTILEQYHWYLQRGQGGDGCLLYKGPRIPKARRTLSLSLAFVHNGQSHNIRINIMIVAMLLESRLTDEQKEGIIHKRWETSHLCGNWTCMNIAHINLELGTVNLDRNVCFRNRHGPCLHAPQCLKHLKVDVKSLRQCP